MDVRGPVGVRGSLKVNMVGGESLGVSVIVTVARGITKCCPIVALVVRNIRTFFSSSLYSLR